MDAGGLVNALLVSVEVGVFLMVVGSDGEGLGELVDFFWKKPKMDFWFFPDCEAEAGCFFCEGRGVDISFPSRPRTMATVFKENYGKNKGRRGELSYRCDFQFSGVGDASRSTR